MFAEQRSMDANQPAEDPRPAWLIKQDEYRAEHGLRTSLEIAAAQDGRRTGGRKLGREFPVCTRVRVTEQEAGWLAELAAVWGCSQGEVWRRAIAAAKGRGRPQGPGEGAQGREEGGRFAAGAVFPVVAYLRLTPAQHADAQRLAERWGCELATALRGCLLRAAAGAGLAGA